MQLILISPPKMHTNELDLLHQCFNLGLKCYHLRKPAFSLNDMAEYLREIDEKYINKVVLHSHHQLKEDFNLKGIHFREPDRKQFLRKLKAEQEGFTQELQQSQKLTLSSSIHSLEDLKTESDYFDYVFLSPVFESISKQGYKPKIKWEVSTIKEEVKPQLIALGGIEEDKILEVKKLGFEGVAVLGAVWKEKQHMIENFKKILNKCQEVESMY